MKLYRFVSYTSLVVILLLALVLGSLPARFPGSFIAWKPAILFASPAIVIVVLLFLKPLCSKKVFLAVILFLTGIAVLGIIFGWMSPVLLGIFLVACMALYLSGSTPQLNLRHK
jgi:hypothetical protein